MLVLKHRFLYDVGNFAMGTALAIEDFVFLQNYEAGLGTSRAVTLRPGLFHIKIQFPEFGGQVWGTFYEKKELFMRQEIEVS